MRIRPVSIIFHYKLIRRTIVIVRRVLSKTLQTIWLHEHEDIDDLTDDIEGIENSKKKMNKPELI